MKLKKVLENISTDEKNREVSLSIYKNMLEHLKSGGETQINPSSNIRKFFVEVKLSEFHFNLMSKFYSLKIKFFNRFDKVKGIMKWGGTNGSYIVFNHVDFELFFQNYGIPLGDIKSSRKRKNIISKMKTQDFEDEVTDHIAYEFEQIPELRDTFFEEIHHYLDYVRTEGDIDFGNEGEYYKRDTEINAKLQSAISKFENDYLMGRSVGNYEIESGEFQNEWKKDFQSFKDWFFDNMISKEFTEKISEDQYERIINRLYKFWEDKVEK